MNFKEFLLKEELALGDMGTRIDKLFNTQQFANHTGAYVSNTDFNQGPPEGSDAIAAQDIGDPSWMPKTPGADVVIPSVEKTGRITALLTKKNPIYVRLSDGTEASFTYDEYNRIEGEPALGKVMTLIFQRHPEDPSRTYSTITKAIVKD